MATLWIREYVTVGSGGSGRAAPIAQEPGTDQAALTYSTSAASAAFAAGTRFIGIISDAAFHYVVATTPTATTGAFKVPANTLHFVGVSAGQKIAAIAAA